jgi:hypothetical protein
VAEKKEKKMNVQIIKRKYIMTNINTQETDYSVYIVYRVISNKFDLLTMIIIPYLIFYYTYKSNYTIQLFFEKIVD